MSLADVEAEAEAEKSRAWKRTEFGKVRQLWLEELFITEAETQCAVKHGVQLGVALHCSSLTLDARVPRRIVGRILGNSFPINNIVISLHGDRWLL